MQWKHVSNVLLLSPTTLYLSRLFEYQKIVKDLVNNKGIRILRKDKGRGIVIMDSSKHIEKCLSRKICWITDDRTKRIECKIERCIRKIKTKLAKQSTYSCILLALSLESFTELPKFLNLPNGGNITELLLDL